MVAQAPNRGDVAYLADVASQVLNRAVWAEQDSTGQHMVKVRAELLVRLQDALKAVYPDDRDHSLDLARALVRELRRA